MSLKFYQKLYLFLSIFLSINVQLIGQIDSSDAKIFNPFRDLSPYRTYLPYDNDQNNWEIFIPKSMLRNDLSNRLKWNSNEVELVSLKISLKLLRQLEYRNRMKYDLGELGKYLGISKNIMALILAILSLLKN